MVKYIATIDATHAGFVNGNNTWYLEDHMRAAVDTWVTPFNKPILRHHDKKSDAIGYVIAAQYVEDEKYGSGTNLPKGHIRLRAVISDMDAVQKIRDGRYNTVSIGCDVSSVRCSICDHNIADEGLCEHVRGKVYDGEKCFWELGGMKYTECSYVNSPADEYASTLRMDEEETTGMHVNNKKEDSKHVFMIDEVSTDKDETEDWTDHTEDDLEMAYWAMKELNDKLDEDARISATARKELPASDFCGPNKSLPITDCEQIELVRSILDNYNGSGNKTKLLACVDKRAKTLGYDSKEDNPTMQREELMSLKLEDILARDDVQKHISDALADKDTQLSGMQALDEKARTLETTVEDKEKEIESLKENADSLEKENADLKTIVHMNLVDKVFALREGLQKKDVKDLKDEKEIADYKAELAKRSDESLTDSISDLEKEEPIEMIVKKIEASDSGETSDSDESKDVEDSTKDKEVKVTREDTVKSLIFADDETEE